MSQRGTQEVNLGGGYFSQSVTYVANFFNNEDNYPIYRQKQFLAIGGNMQLGYHLMINWISFDLNIGFQALKRLLALSIEYEGVEFRRDRAAYESFYSDDIMWAFEAGSIINAVFTLKYNINSK